MRFAIVVTLAAFIFFEHAKASDSVDPRIYYVPLKNGSGQFERPNDACAAAMPEPALFGSVRIVYSSPAWREKDPAAGQPSGCTYTVTYYHQSGRVEIYPNWFGQNWAEERRDCPSSVYPHGPYPYTSEGKCWRCQPGLLGKIPPRFAEVSEAGVTESKNTAA